MRPVRVIEGGVTFLDRDNVDTDQLLPSRFLKRIERSGFGKYLLYDQRRDNGLELPPNPVLVSGARFGSGSSREHAAWAIEDYGFRAVIAPSFGEIFANNATTVGVLPVALDRDACLAVVRADRVRVDLPAQTVTAGGRSWTFDIDAEVKDRLVQGLDDIDVTLRNGPAIDAFEARHDLLTFSAPTTGL